MKVTFESNTTKYQLTGTQGDFVLCKLVEIQEGKNKGEIVERDKRFYPRLELVVNVIMELELKASDAQTLDDMRTCIMATRHLVKTTGFTGE